MEKRTVTPEPLEVVDLSDVESVAKEARYSFENQLIDGDLLCTLYQQYNPLENIELFVVKAEGFFPNLNCGLASVYLQEQLAMGVVKKGKYLNNDHTFLLFELREENSIVVDITADQYGGPKVYVGPLEPPWSLIEEEAEMVSTINDRGKEG